MAVIRFTDRPFFRNPWVEFEKMRRDMENMMRGIIAEGGGAAAEVFPPLTISEDNNMIYVRAEVPGITPDKLDISVEGDTLFIRGERKECEAKPNTSYHRREIECGSFSRAVTLPTKVSFEKISAKTENGILTITLPKAPEVKPRRITVNVG